MDFEEIAEQYKESKNLIFRKYIEEYTLLRIVGDVVGKTVLDLACGEGVYSRQLRRGGAARVVGVDVCKAMLALGRAEEQRQPLGIEYILGDCASLGRIGSFDRVVGSYLMNFASNREELLQFCETIYENLAEGGHFSGFNNNPSQSPEFYESSKKYGFIKSGPTPPREGDTIRFTNFVGDIRFIIDNFYLTKETHEWAFREAGFRTFQWRPAQVSEDGVRLMGSEFWRAFLEHPPLIGLKASK